MNEIRDKILTISRIIHDITNTARNVNIESGNRKNICHEGLTMNDKLLDMNREIINNFENIYENLKQLQASITKNSDEFTLNINIFKHIIDTINAIKSILNSLKLEIKRLTEIVDEIRDDTDEIFTLALNASIVSSKYSHTSGVFDILANKLDEMSNFINQNLDNIVKVVEPITGGIIKLMEENSIVLSEIEKGHDNFSGFPVTLNKQKLTIDELKDRARITDVKIIDQKKRLEEIAGKFILMDNDATEAITGSGNVMKFSENLAKIINETLVLFDSGKDYSDKIRYMEEQSHIITDTAGKVNVKSKSQLEFSLSAKDFCDSIIQVSQELKETAKSFSGLSVDNSTMVELITKNLGNLIDQLKKIEKKIMESNQTILNFIEDYKQNDNIIEFLKNILKSMKIIGMLSRIESSRDPEEFQGFMTISDNIAKLQDRIHNNIPVIEDNINKTHEHIVGIKANYEEMTSNFSVISNFSNSIIGNLKEITNISKNSEIISRKIDIESIDMETILENLRNLLKNLSEIVKIPIEGSAANMGRGIKIGDECNEILRLTAGSAPSENGDSGDSKEQSSIVSSGKMPDGNAAGGNEKKGDSGESMEIEFENFEKIFNDQNAVKI